MAKAVWKIDKNGKRTYVGHVPDSYKLQKGEHFGIPPEDVWQTKDDFVEVIRDA